MMKICKHQHIFSQSSAKLKIKNIASSVMIFISQKLKLLMRILEDISIKIDIFRLIKLDFVPRKDDIFIVTYPRSGTTWLQMILYQLATDGSMDFSHISEFSPYFEFFATKNLQLENFDSPRILKSHLPYSAIPKGAGKYIYVARNGKDVAVSYFHLYRNVFGFEGTFSDFFELFMCGNVNYGSWFKHVEGWWLHKDDSNVLFLTYEELKQDLKGCIQRISNFCGFKIATERFPEILERCSFTFMKQHESKFDFVIEKMLAEGLKPNSFIRKGQIGNWKSYLSTQEAMLFDQEFDKRMCKLSINFNVFPQQQ